MVRPYALREGDTVAMLALSSPAKGEDEPDRARAALEALGLSVKMGRTTTLRRDYLAGSAAERARDLAKAVADPKARGIFFLRGGYGSAQLLPLIDFRAIRERRLLVAGFSDLTSILNALARAGLATLHVPTMCSHFVAREPDADMVALLRGHIFGEDRLLPLKSRDAGAHRSLSRGGDFGGTLIGGNLCVFSSLIGTPWAPNPRGKVLFFEETGEVPYRVDRFLTHIRNSGYLAKLNGIVLGQFTDCEPKTPNRWTWQDAVAEALRGLDVPVLAGLPCGHGHPSLPLPIGTRVECSPKGGSVSISAPLAIRRPF